jgi:dTDP-4-amino-4,6-dideoxygalactose transaminase
MTTGEGGMIVTADDQLAERMRLLSLHGMSRNAWQRYTSAGTWAYEVVEAGYKYNMTDIQAALGIHQLRRLDRFIETRQFYAQLYNEAFSSLKELEVPQTHSDRNHVYHLYVLRLNLECLSLDRAQFIEELKVRNIGASVHFIPVHLHPYYTEQFGYRIGSLPDAEALYERIVSIPLYPRMSETDVNSVIQAVYDIVTIHRA